MRNILINRIFTYSHAFFVNIFFVENYLVEVYDEYELKMMCIADNKAVLTQKTASLILDKYPLFFDGVDLQYSDEDVTHKLVISGQTYVSGPGAWTAQTSNKN